MSKRCFVVFKGGSGMLKYTYAGLWHLNYINHMVLVTDGVSQDVTAIIDDPNYITLKIHNKKGGFRKDRFNLKKGNYLIIIKSKVRIVDNIGKKIINIYDEMDKQNITALQVRGGILKKGVILEKSDIDGAFMEHRGSDKVYVIKEGVLKRGNVLPGNLVVETQSRAA